MIRNILFDLDDTLFDFQLAQKEAIKKTLIHLGIEPEERLLKRYGEINLSQWKLLELGRFTLPEVKIRRYELLFEEIGVDYSAEDATAYYEEMLGTGHYFVDGAEEILQKLSKRCRLYIASNGTPKVQHRRIESSGIEKYMSGLFISQEIGCVKPNLDFFEYCFAHIEDFRREETAIVGDSLTSDIKGGNNAGIMTVWYNPQGNRNDTDIEPCFEICHLSQLEALFYNSPANSSFYG